MDIKTKLTLMIEKIPKGFLVLVPTTLIICAICIGIIAHSEYKATEIEKMNPLKNDTISVEDHTSKVNIHLSDIETITEYENIKTYNYSFVDDDNNPIIFSAGYIELTEIIDFVNSKLAEVPYRVCEIGIIGNSLYIQVDTRDTLDRSHKVNIITIKDNLKVEEWTKVTETIHNTVKVYTGSLISYQTTLGNRHYMYVYSDFNTAYDVMNEGSNNTAIEDMQSTEVTDVTEVNDVIGVPPTNTEEP